MNILDFVYKCLGFESDDIKVVKKTNKASYNLKISEQRPDEIDGVAVFYPSSLGECKERSEMTKRGVPFMLDLRDCSTQEKNKILGYFAGVMDTLGAKIENIDKNLFIFLPKNFEIEVN